MFQRSEGREQLTDFGDLFLPDEAAEPILSRPVRASLLEWLVEIQAEPQLAEVGVKARKRAIFDGPPGVGKTTLAHHLAARLGLPMLACRPDRLISKYVGESGRLIGRLFDLARGGILLDGAAAAVPVVLFLDEFDSLARQRRASEQGSDDARNEMVNVLLQRLEQHEGYLIAATNYGAEIDQAMWRRFDIHVTLELPGDDERRRIMARYLAPFALPSLAMAEMSEAMAGASPALMRAFCEDLKRQIVVGPRLRQDMGREAVIGRVLASRHPHPKLGKPRLWSHGAEDRAVQLMPWPLPDLAAAAAMDAEGEVLAGAPADDGVVPSRRRP